MTATAKQSPLSNTQTEFDDGKDPIQLLATVWEGRWILATVIVGAAALAGIYTGVATKVYRAQADIYPTNDNKLALISPGFNLHKENYTFDKLTPNFLYTAALKNLRSENIAKRFLEKNKEKHAVFFKKHSTEIEKTEQFLQALRINSDKTYNVTSVSLSGEQPDTTAFVLQGYLAFVSSITIGSASNDLLAAIELNIQYIDKSILQARQLSENQINDKATILTEAIEVAKALNIKESKLDQLTNTEIEVVILNDKFYLFGTKALQAELAVLEKRRKNDTFVPKLRELQSLKSALQIEAEKIRQNISKVDAFSVLVSLQVPTTPVSPKPVLIIVTAVFAGTIFGLLAIFVRQWIRAYRDRMPPAKAVNYKKNILKRDGNYRIG